MRRLTIAAVAVVLSIAACSSGSTEPEGEATGSSPSVMQQPPSSDGDECTDPVGDLSASARAEGSGSEPAGLDLVRGSALVEGDQLDVRFETAGQISQLTSPLFVVAQGDPGRELSFEIRAQPGEGDDWQLTLIRWDPTERRFSIPNPVTVQGNILSYRVPLENLPPIGLYIAFGAAAEVEGVGTVIDDCNPLQQQPTTTR